MKNRPRIFHECTNEDARFEYSWFHSWMVVHFAGVVARVSDLFPLGDVWQSVTTNVAVMRSR
jgi:hypothetical protein